MEKSLSSLKLDNENTFLTKNQTGFRCDECNRTFPKPILATVSSPGSVQKYYACPHCFSKVGGVKYSESEETRETLIAKKNIKKVMTENKDNVKCEHFLGYLKKRPKDMPIPDDCLTCDKMIECLLH